MTQIPNTTASVCCGFTTITGDREFKTIQEVLTLAEFNSCIHIKLCGNLIDIPPFNLSTTSEINIDGDNQFSINFANDIATISSSQTLKFSNIEITGTNIIANSGSELIFNNSTANMNIDLSGDLQINNSTIRGDISLNTESNRYLKNSTIIGNINGIGFVHMYNCISSNKTGVPNLIYEHNNRVDPNIF